MSQDIQQTRRLIFDELSKIVDPEIGVSIMELELFEGAEGLRNVIRSGVPMARRSPAWVRLTSRYAVFYKKLKGYTRPSRS